MLSRVLRFKFSQQSVPVVDLSDFLTSPSSSTNSATCKSILDSFHKYGCLVVKDPRVKPSYNEEFLNMMENYFDNRSKRFYKGEKLEDFFPEYGFQTGATPEYKELAKPHSEVINQYQNDNKASTGSKPPYDAKWRFFWRIGERPAGIRELDPPQYIPKDFPEFELKMVIILIF